MQAEKFSKFSRKDLCHGLVYDKVYRLQNSQVSQKKKVLVLEAQYQHQIVFIPAIFYYTAYNSLLLFASLTQCALTHSWAAR